jgi:hypothetical protein
VATVGGDTIKINTTWHYHIPATDRGKFTRIEISAAALGSGASVTLPIEYYSN